MCRRRTFEEVRTCFNQLATVGNYEKYLHRHFFFFLIYFCIFNRLSV